jgi:hypothetical protein
MSHGLRRCEALRVLPAVVACGLLTSGCATRDVQAVNGGPPSGPVVAARPLDIQWANALCTTLNPLFAALSPPSSPTTPAYRDQVTKATKALHNADMGMHTVGPPPSPDAQGIISAIDDRLDQVGQSLATAAGQLKTAGPTGSTAQARAALTSFERNGLKPLLVGDPSLSNALVYAPACAHP